MIASQGRTAEGGGNPMLTTELSASMERLVLSVVILIGSFALVGIAMLTQSQYASAILVMASGLMGGVAAAWQLGTQAKQTGDQMANAQQQAITPVSIPPDVLKSALSDLLKEQAK